MILKNLKMIEISEWTYYSIEKPFVEYFDRMKDTNRTFKEIEANLPYLEGYYADMVIANVNSFYPPTLLGLYTEWKNNRR